jgi:hypothetical protein
MDKMDKNMQNGTTLLSINRVTQIMSSGPSDEQPSQKTTSPKANKSGMRIEVPYLTRGLSMIRFLGRHRNIAILSSVFGQINGVIASPTPSGFKHYMRYEWYRFTQDIAGPLLINTILAGFLGIGFIDIVRADQGRWKDSHVLLFSTGAVTVGSFFLGMDETVSEWRLVLIETFATALNFAYLKDKLIAFPKFGGLAAFVISSLGLLSALAIADWNDYEGRYADPRVLGAVAISPTTTICSMLWVAAFLKTGIA